MIELYENAFSDELCDKLIKYFHDNKIETYDMFEQVQMVDPELEKEMLDIMQNLTDDYLSKYDPQAMIPEDIQVEGFRVKRYEPNKHRFPLHVDVANKETATRFLAFLFYLNDTEAGTVFDGGYVESKKGNVLVFPPMWMFPHEGEMPTETPKYIASNYLHYK